MDGFPSAYYLALADGDVHTVGLLKGGTVLAVGKNTEGQCDVSVWKNVIAIAVGDYHTVGLQSDGFIVAAGQNDYGQCDVLECNLFSNFQTIPEERRKSFEQYKSELKQEERYLQEELDESCKGFFSGRKRGPMSRFSTE